MPRRHCHPPRKRCVHPALCPARVVTIQVHALLAPCSITPGRQRREAELEGLALCQEGRLLGGKRCVRMSRGQRSQVQSAVGRWRVGDRVRRSHKCTWPRKCQHLCLGIPPPLLPPSVPFLGRKRQTPECPTTPEPTPGFNMPAASQPTKVNTWAHGGASLPSLLQSQRTQWGTIQP